MKLKKTIIFSLIFIGLFVMAFFNFTVAKFEVPNNVLNQTGVESQVQVEDVKGVVGIIILVLTWTYSIFFVIAVLFIIFAAYQYLTGAEDPEEIKGAHKRIKWAAIAIAVALLALSFNVIIKNFIGASGNGGNGVVSSSVQ